MPEPWAALRLPALRGGACTGRAPLFDYELDGETPAQRHARHTTAARICADCPALARCEAIARSLPANTRGVWAGKLLAHHHRPRPIPI